MYCIVLYCIDKKKRPCKGQQIRQSWVRRGFGREVRQRFGGGFGRWGQARAQILPKFRRRLGEVRLGPVRRLGGG